MPKAIIFDVDGTLAETEDLHRKAFNRAFAEYGLSWHWDRSLYRDLLEVSGGKERIRHYDDQQIADHLPAADRDRFIREMHGVKTGIYTQMVAAGEAHLRPGVRELIESAAANGLRLAIATTTSLPNVEALLGAAFGTRGMDYFEAVCAGDVVAHKKPAPDIYLMALEELGLAASDCIAIEDSRNGLLSARQAGIPTIVTPGIYTRDQDFTEAMLVAASLEGIDVLSTYSENQ